MSFSTFFGVKIHNPDFLAISIVQWIDGIKLDLDFLKSLKLINKNLTIIGDGTQFCGTSKFNFDKSPFDVLISSGYKWMFSGYGIAFILINGRTVVMLIFAKKTSVSVFGKR